MFTKFIAAKVTNSQFLLDNMYDYQVIVYMMLLGRHPFDLDCDASDEEIGRRIKEQQLPSFDITRHLSASAMDLLR